MSDKTLFIDPVVRAKFKALVEAVCIEGERRGRNVKAIVLITRDTSGNLIITGGCDCQGCLNSMLLSLEQVRDDTLERLPDTAAGGSVDVH